MEEIKPISEWFIKPNYKLELSNIQQQPYYHLSPIDLAMLSIDNMQEGVLFAKPRSSSSTSIINSDFLEKLKATLSLALNYFYPLAGRLVTERYEDEHSCCIFVDCNKSPGARLIHASAPKITIMDIMAPNTDVPLFVQSFFDLGERSINHDGHTRPLLSIQVTDLADGVFMGFAMNHAVVDGTSLVHFLQFWSEIYMRMRSYDGDDHINQLVSMPLAIPIHERSLVPYGYGPAIKLPFLDPNEFITQAVNEIPLRERIFYFSATSMAMLKAKAKAECNDNTINITSFQALSALAWRSITRARNLPPQQDTTCILPTNIRSRFHPPLSNNYFGNYVKAASAAAKVGELSTRNLGWVAMLLHQASKTVDDKTVRDVFLQPYLGAHPSITQKKIWSPWFAHNRVVINGSARFDLYGLDYGLGKPVAARNGYANRGDGVILATAGREGGGSVELTIRLKPQRMNALLSDEEFLSFVTFSSKL